MTSRSDDLATTLRRLGPVRVVGLVTIAVVTVVLVWAVVDVRGLLADRPPTVAPVAAASQGARGDDTKTQVAVKVTFSGTGPFTATVVDASKKQRTFRSGGEDVVFSRVYQGPGPYLLASLQTSADATIRCRIDVDGDKVSATEQSGLYAQTVCAG